MPTKIATVPYGDAPTSNAELIATTIGAQGNQLPLGLFETEHGRIVEFEFNPPIMKWKKKLGQLKTRKDLRQQPGRLVSYWLAVALARLGPYDLNKLGLDKAAQVTARLSFGDVLFLLFRWQFVEDESGLKIPGDACGACNKSFEAVRIQADSIELTCLPDRDTDGREWSWENQPASVVGLAKGMPHKTKELKEVQIRTLLLQAPTWIDSFWKLTQDNWGNNDLRAWYLLRSATRAHDVDDRPIADASFDELWPADIGRMDQALALVTPTPTMAVDVICPQCEALNEVPIRIDSPGFFI